MNVGIVASQQKNIPWDTYTAPVATASSTIGLCQPQDVFNTTKSLTGTPYGTTWFTQDGQGVLHRLIWNLGSVRQLNNIRIINFHDFNTNLPNGVPLIKIYVVGSNPSTVHNSNVTVSQCVYDGQIPQWSLLAPNSYFHVPLSSVLSGQYIVFDTFSAWGNPPGWDRLGLRRVNISSSAVV